MREVVFSWWAVLAAGVLNMLIGWVWYSMGMFGKRWMKLLGKTEAELKASAKPSMYGFMLVSALVMAYILAQVIGWAGAVSVGQGAAVGFMVWIGFVATSYLGLTVFENRKWEMYFINVGYYLVALVATGAVLAVWR